RTIVPLAVETSIRIRHRAVRLVRELLPVPSPRPLGLGLLRTARGRRRRLLATARLGPERLEALHARIGLHFRPIHREVTPTEESGLGTLPEHLVAEPLPEPTLRPPLVPEPTERGVVRHRIVEVQAAEPAHTGVHGDLVTELAVPQVVELGQQHHAHDQLGIDARAAFALAVARGHLLTHEAEV